MKRYILGMSKSKANLRSELEQNVKPCMIHLSKLWLFPNSQYSIHWRKEVFNFYPDIDTLKPRNKVPSSKFIFDNTWESKKHLFDRIVQRAIDLEEDLEPDSSRLDNLDKLYSLMEYYFRWLSNELSEKEFLYQREVISKLKSLGF